MVRGWLYGELKLKALGLVLLGAVPVPVPVVPPVLRPAPVPVPVPPAVPFPPAPPAGPAPPVPPVVPRPPPAPAPPPAPPGRCGSGSAELEKAVSSSRGFPLFELVSATLFALLLGESPISRRALPPGSPPTKPRASKA